MDSAASTADSGVAATLYFGWGIPAASRQAAVAILSPHRVMTEEGLIVRTPRDSSRRARARLCVCPTQRQIAASPAFASKPPGQERDDASWKSTGIPSLSAAAFSIFSSGRSRL